jgi:hypothetical protein
VGTGGEGGDCACARYLLTVWVVNTGICAWLHSNPQPVATEDGDAYPQDCITQRASLLENRNASLIVDLRVRV